jgi:hypothetical protein
MKIVILILLVSISLFAQEGTSKGPVASKSTAGSAAALVPSDLAKAVLAAHGGDKLKKMQTLLVKGSVDVSVQGQAMPGAFSTAVSGEKYYFEIVTAMQQLKQVFDGRETSSSLQGFSLPPVTSLGFPLLTKVGDNGYEIAALPEGSKKKKGFRMTTPEGFYTDFFVDEKTSQIKGYEAKWITGNQTISTSVEIDEFLTVEGVAVPKKYAQRFDLGPLTAYANFKAKDIKINSKIEDSAFAIGK